MPRYQVKSGRVLPHGGQVLEEGTIVEDLPRHVGEDSVVRDLVQEIDESGEPVAPVDRPDADLERFRPHERVTLLEQRLSDAKARVATLEHLLADAQSATDKTGRTVGVFPMAGGHNTPKDEE